MHVEYLAAGALPEAMRGLARSIARRLKPLAGIPQRVFSRGPISLITPRPHPREAPARPADQPVRRMAA
jgi:hypothetical protein